jgi:hypothetical protein
MLAIPADEPALRGGLGAMLPGEHVRTYRCRGTQCETPLEASAVFAAWL